MPWEQPYDGENATPISTPLRDLDLHEILQQEFSDFGLPFSPCDLRAPLRTTRGAGASRTVGGARIRRSRVPRDPISRTGGTCGSADHRSLAGRPKPATGIGQNRRTRLHSASGIPSEEARPTNRRTPSGIAIETQSTERHRPLLRSQPASSDAQCAAARTAQQASSLPRSPGGARRLEYSALPPGHLVKRLRGETECRSSTHPSTSEQRRLRTRDRGYPRSSRSRMLACARAILKVALLHRPREVQPSGLLPETPEGTPARAAEEVRTSACRRLGTPTDSSNAPALRR